MISSIGFLGLNSFAETVLTATKEKDTNKIATFLSKFIVIPPYKLPSLYS
jgi:hypothetical protein